MGKFHQYQLADKINTAFGTNEFSGEDLSKKGIPAISGHIKGLVAIGVLIKKADKKKRNTYQLQDFRFRSLERRWK